MKHDTNASPRKRKITVYLFNVGQGDNILMRLPNGEYGIIDFYYEPKLHLTEPPALTYLKKIRRRLNPDTPIVLSFVCISHPDYDHVKGVSDLLRWIEDKTNNVQLKNLWLFAGTILHQFVAGYNQYVYENEESDSTHRASAVSKQLRALFKFSDRWNGVPEFLHDIRRLPGDFGNEMKVVTIAPLGKHVNKFNKSAMRQFIKFAVRGKKGRGAEQNLLSSILMMIYGRHRLFFGGDTGSTIWEECIDHYDKGNFANDFGELKGNFVKASHHGSKHSSSELIWTRILDSEGHVGISAGTGYRHPHLKTLVHIRSIQRTDSDENKNLPKIVSTNSCEKCITDHELPPRMFEWLLSKRPRLHQDVEDKFREDRPLEDKAAVTPGVDDLVEGNPIQNGKPMFLTTYVFEFEPQSELKIYKGVSHRQMDPIECVYKTEESAPFPHCALDKLARRNAETGIS